MTPAQVEAMLERLEQGQPFGGAARSLGLPVPDAMDGMAPHWQRAIESSRRGVMLVYSHLDTRYPGWASMARYPPTERRTK